MKYLKIYRCIISLPRTVKISIVILVDVSLALATVWFAFYLRLGHFVFLRPSDHWFPGFISASIISVSIAIPILGVSGLYRSIFRHSGPKTLLTIGRTLLLYGVVYFVLISMVGIYLVPRTIGIIQPILFLLLVGASRLLAGAFLGQGQSSRATNSPRPRALIYGASEVGRQLATAMTSNKELEVVGFVDDDPALHDRILNGLTIYSPERLQNLITLRNISVVLLALPEMSRKRRNEILAKLESLNVAVRFLPSLNKVFQGQISIEDLCEPSIEDLLLREPVVPDLELLSKNVSDKVVMVTGAGGSIGSELCRQILACGPRKLLLIDHCEFSLYGIQQELAERVASNPGVVIPLLASILDSCRIRDILLTWSPYAVYHSAAYKHVPLVEYNPVAGLKNNALGTLRLAEAALEAGVSNFVLISTDKAVRPTNVMGATKRLAEMILQALADKYTSTRFSIVRFGNVLGSSGSVVPEFQRQIRNGGPILLTHPDITRFFMTIPEAAQLVIQAGALSEGGDVFVLDMGDPVRILDLARRMVRLSGLTVRCPENPYGDIEIKIVGLRPGEKLHEELLIGNSPQRTSHPRIVRALETFDSWEALTPWLSSLETAVAQGNATKILTILRDLVRDYRPANEVLDLIYRERGISFNSGD